MSFFATVKLEWISPQREEMKQLITPMSTGSFVFSKENNYICEVTQEAYRWCMSTRQFRIVKDEDSVDKSWKDPFEALEKRVKALELKVGRWEAKGKKSEPAET